MSKQGNLFGWGADFCPRPYNPRNTPRKLAWIKALGESRGIDLLGRRFGNWTVIQRLPGRGRRWLCRCDCGRECSVSSGALLGRRSTQCKACGVESARIKRTLRDFEAQYLRAKCSAKREGKPFPLTLEEYQRIAQELPGCHYCTASLRWERRRRGKKVQAHNLDRKDNNRGYEAGNVVPCCDRCNRAKGNRFSYHEWWAMTQYFRVAGRLVVEPAERSSREDLLNRAMELIAEAGGFQVSIHWSEDQRVRHISRTLQ